MQFARRSIIMVLVVLVPITAVWAHPHVFIDSHLDFEMQDCVCVGLWVEWTFDPVFSADVIGQFDSNHDGTFNAAENDLVQKKAFSNLRKYGYFTYIRKGDARWCPDSVDSFKAGQRDGLAIYRFHISLQDKGISDDFSVATFDSTFYCASRYVQEPATILWKGDEPESKPYIELVQDKKHPVYYNPRGSTADMRIYLKWEKGLETAYPEEIRVAFR
jgi:ABC-type uncharacterized transport system substrate-binding protein